MEPEPPRRRGRPRSEQARAAVLAAAGELMLEGGMGASRWRPSRGAPG